MTEFNSLFCIIFVSLVLLESVCIINCKQNDDSEDDDVDDDKDLNEAASQLKDVCANRRVPLIRVHDVKKMIIELKKNPSICSEDYWQSFYELSPILVKNHKFNACSDKRFNQIADYHFRYINPKEEVYRPLVDDPQHLKKKVTPKLLDAARLDHSIQLDKYGQVIKIPIALEQFFKAWALQVSGVCKIMLVENLKTAIQTTMDDDDMELIAKFAKFGDKAENPLTGMPLDDLSFYSLVYIPHLEDAIEGEDDELFTKTTYLNLIRFPEINRFMHNCKFRYKPIYSKLVLPVVRLAKLGYDYMGPKIAEFAAPLKNDFQLKTWLALTSICESQGEFELFEDENAPLETIPVEYSPVKSYNVEGNLWIKNEDSLASEFDRIRGERGKGLNKVWFMAEVGTSKVVAMLDPMRYKFYRQHQGPISNFLNILSTATTAAGIFATFMGG